MGWVNEKNVVNERKLVLKKWVFFRICLFFKVFIELGGREEVYLR